MVTEVGGYCSGSCSETLEENFKFKKRTEDKASRLFKEAT